VGAILPLTADEPKNKEEPKKEEKSYQVPYKLTTVKHILIRAKINGKGPFNFILDTGAPALFMTEAVAKKAGVTADKTGWGMCDRFEIEGGVVVPKAKGRIETPFQLEGMNGMGLAGVELHGIIGYNILARYKITFDFDSDKLTFAELDFEPKGPMGLGKGGAPGGLDTMGSLMKMVGELLGRKANPDLVLRGFIGVELMDGTEYPSVKSVLASGPAGKTDLKAGDVITKVQGRTVTDSDDVNRFLSKAKPGESLKLTVQRGKETKEIVITVGEGL